ncbi:MAG TPA: hypothetical protein VFK69_08855 [Candidatus Eisenbacteria bacterium]|nr:hypothetical protein [Candidatus Eisenbacteria bacterium]
MKPYSVIRRTLLGFTGTAIALAVFVLATHVGQLFNLVRRALGAFGLIAVMALAGATARASELGVPAPAPRGIVIHDATDVLAHWCHRDADGRLWLSLPDGAQFELVTSTSDPLVSNPGDGAFHPFDGAVVREALDQVRFPLEGISAEVFVLPFPRRSGFESCAAPGIILLSPGVWPLTVPHQHAEFAHELGHIVQYQRMPDADASDWQRYRELRGIMDSDVYNASAPHADRPHEIFAEDFRVLFGGPLAAGSLENPDLASPAAVHGLDGFMAALVGAAPGRIATIRAGRAVEFVLAGGRPAPLQLFDVTGRRVTSLAPVALAGGVAWSWDGTDAAGHIASAGVLFARSPGAPAVARVVWQP